MGGGDGQRTRPGWTEGASRTHGEREARAYNGGLVAEPPAGSRGRAPGQWFRGAKPPKAESLLPLDHPNEGQHLPLVWYFLNPPVSQK